MTPEINIIQYIIKTFDIQYDYIIYHMQLNL